MKDNIVSALRLGGQNLLNCLNPERNYIPYWCMNINEDYTAEYYEWWPQHNIGRWWDAMLRLENAIGFEIPTNIEAKMLSNLYKSLKLPGENLG